MLYGDRRRWLRHAAGQGGPNFNGHAHTRTQDFEARANSHARLPSETPVWRGKCHGIALALPALSRLEAGNPSALEALWLRASAWPCSGSKPGRSRGHGRVMPYAVAPCVVMVSVQVHDKVSALPYRKRCCFRGIRGPCFSRPGSEEQKPAESKHARTNSGSNMSDAVVPLSNQPARPCRLLSAPHLTRALLSYPPLVRADGARDRHGRRLPHPPLVRADDAPDRHRRRHHAPAQGPRRRRRHDARPASRRVSSAHRRPAPLTSGPTSSRAP